MRRLFNLLTMFGPLSAAKFWVAVILGIAQFVNIYAGYDLGLDEQTLTAILGGFGALLVWWVPNLRKVEPEADPRSSFPHPPTTY